MLTYSYIQTPAGAMTAFFSDIGLVYLAFANEDEEQLLKAVAARTGNEPVARTTQSAALLAQLLLEYYEGTLKDFSETSLKLDVSYSPPFALAVLKAASTIDYGQTWSYSQLAQAAGNAKAVRAAASAMASNPFPLIVPCHRVLPASGEVGRYRGGVELKIQLLEMEASSVFVG